MMGNSGDSKAFNVLSYIGPLFIVSLLAKPGDADARFHANQGLVLFLAEIACSIILALLGLVLGFIPVLGAILTWIVSLAVAVIVLLFILYVSGTPCPAAARSCPISGTWSSSTKAA